MKNKLIAAGLAFLLLTLTGCSNMPPVFDDKNWIDDSANSITLNLNGVNIDKGISSSTQEKLNKVATATDKLVTAYSYAGGAFAKTFYSEQNGRSAIISDAVNPFYDTENGYHEFYEACKVDSKPMRLYKDYRLSEILKELASKSVDYSFSTHNRIVLIETGDELFTGTTALTRAVIISFQENGDLDSVATAYFGDNFDGKHFSTLYAKALKGDTLYYVGYMKFYSNTEEVLDEDIKTSYLLNAPESLLDGKPNLFTPVDETEYKFLPLNYNEKTKACSQVQEITVKVSAKSKD